MTDLDLDSIKARCEAATPGPWRWWDASELRSLVFEDDPHLDDLSAPIVGEPIMGGFGEPEWDISVADAEFIAHAREDVPALVAEVKRLRAALDDIWLSTDDDADVLKEWAGEALHPEADGPCQYHSEGSSCFRCSALHPQESSDE